ncbi:MAG: glycosyltransferase, partial [Xanthomonadales bacterium]|nr:glycosyltransferase [Xanthomonadales bacterium]
AQPFVSIHLACCNEPPEMVILTLDSLAALDYANYEVLVIDNNTKREEVWKPVEEYCARLGPRFRFFHLNPWPGFKAGALNFGLEQIDPRAEVVAVVDADYVVRRDWLSALTGHFGDPKVAVVQCPQAHREFEDNAFRRMTAWEYDGFFRIGMH